MATIAKRQQTLHEFTGAPVTLHACPCCLNKTSRDPADIIKEVEAERARKADAKAARDAARREKERDAFRALMQTHVPVPKQSAKTGKWRGVEWIPKIMLETAWMIPRHVHSRIVAGWEFDKAAGCDLMRFKVKRATTSRTYDPVTMRTTDTMALEHFTLWDLLMSAFVALPEVPLLRSPSS